MAERPVSTGPTDRRWAAVANEKRSRSRHAPGGRPRDRHDETGSLNPVKSGGILCVGIGGCGAADGGFDRTEGETVTDTPTETQTETTAAPPAADSADASASRQTTFPPGSSGNRLSTVVVVLLVIVGIALLIFFFGALRHWVALKTGTLHGGPDVFYNFWSGFGSDLGEATLISAVGIGVYTGVRKVNCHTKGCWRIGHHPLDGTPYILCRHHHPDVPNEGASHEHIIEQLRLHKEREAAKEKARLGS